MVGNAKEWGFIVDRSGFVLAVIERTQDEATL